MIDKIFNLCIVMFPLFTGLYYEKHFKGALLILTIILIAKCRGSLKNGKKINIGDKKIFLLACIVIIISVSTYFINEMFYNEFTSRSLVFDGTCQLLEMFMFYLICLQKEGSNEISKKQDIAIIISGVILSLLAIFPEFYREGRFEATFEYANALAQYLFISLIILVNTKLDNKYRLFAGSVILIGIILTNCRVVYGFLLLSLLIICITKYKNRIFNRKNIIQYFVGGIVLFGIGVVTILMNSKLTNRFNINTIIHDADLRMSYFSEANDIIAEYPFGLGYEGYLHKQQVKENKYKLRLVHNYIYQWGLNYGIITMCIGVMGIVCYTYKCYKDKKIFNYINMILLFVFIHNLIDIGFSFLVISNTCILLASRNMLSTSNKEDYEIVSSKNLNA